jgi:hypothetical protein
LKLPQLVDMSAQVVVGISSLLGVANRIITLGKGKLLKLPQLVYMSPQVVVGIRSLLGVANRIITLGKGKLLQLVDICQVAGGIAFLE